MGTVANKRQRKKQQAQSNIKALKQVGINDRKKIQQLKNKPTVVNEVVKKKQRNITAQQRSRQIERLGYKVSEHSSKRYWSQKRWTEWYEKEQDKQRKKKDRERQQRERRKKDETDLYLLMFWKEKTDAYMDSQELIDQFKYEYRYMSTDYLIQSLNAFIQADKVPAMIGTTSVVIAKGKDRKNVIQFYKGYDDGSLAGWNEWGLVYEGKAVRYKELLIAVHTVIRLLYDNSEKGHFINDLLTSKLPAVNPRMAKRLAKDLNWRGF